MPRFIFKIADEQTKKDYYGEWSTIIDAPVTEGMELAEFKEYYEKEYGRSGMMELDTRLSRVEKSGTSSFSYRNSDSLLETYFFNRKTNLNLETLKRAIIEGGKL